MFKVEKHDNSKEYFKSLLIEADALYITPNTTLRYAILENNRVKDHWQIDDIDNLFKTVFPKWNDLLVNIRFQVELREVILKNLGLEEEEALKNEYRYMVDNIKELLNEIKALYLGGIYEINKIKETEFMKAFKKVFNEFVSNKYFLDMTIELRDAIHIRSFYTRYAGYNGKKIRKIYFYNFNELTLERIKLINILDLLGFEIIFRIPFFHKLEEVNKCWTRLYNQDSFFAMEKGEGRDFSQFIDKNNYISLVEGLDPYSDEFDVETREYNSVAEFKEECKNTKLITLLKNNVKECLEVNKQTRHLYESKMGRFLYYLYDCSVTKDDVKLTFEVYYELITSGWIEDREFNGIRFREYLRRNVDYFKDIKSINEILGRIDKLKDINEINDIFEGKIKARINKDETKKFLSNPFRAYGFANFEKFNVTSNYLEIITRKLKRVIMSCLNISEGDDLVDYGKHLEELNKTFDNNYMRAIYSKNPEFIMKIKNAIGRKHIDAEFIHKEELRDLFSTILVKKEENLEEDKDFALNQLEGLILRDKKIDIIDDKPTIHITDLSFKAFSEYIQIKKNEKNIISSKDRVFIIKNNINEFDEAEVDTLLKLEEITNTNYNDYLKFVMANLFINFNGKIILSWIKDIRNNDIESVLFKQMSTLYKRGEAKKLELDFLEDIDEEELSKEYEEAKKHSGAKSITKKLLPEVAFRDLDFCEQKFMLSSVIGSYPIYYSDFHNKILLSNMIANLKYIFVNGEDEIGEHLLSLFPQWNDVEKENMVTVNRGFDTMRKYKLFEGVNYPVVMDKLYILRSRYYVTERYKIKNRYFKEDLMKTDDLYEEFVKAYFKDEMYNTGKHCSMCPHYLICKGGEV